MGLRISRVKIDSYGPLRDFDRDLDPGVTLFYGMNESGKTLLVESIVKLLLDGETDAFTAIDRVAGAPHGFLSIENGASTVQIPDADYTDVFPEGTTAADVRNAFVIRDVDLRVPERQRDFGHSSYFREVTDRLMGSQTGKIEAIGDGVADLGNLANRDSDRLMNQQPEKLKDRRRDARELAGRLRSYHDSIGDRGVLRKVRERTTKVDELEAVRDDIAQLKKARRQQKLETGEGLVDDLRETELAIEAHQRGEGEVERYRALKREIEGHREARTDDGPPPSAYRRAAAVAISLFLASLVAAVVSPLPGVSVVAGGLALVVLYLGYKYLGANRRSAERARLVEKANYAGIEADDLPSVYSTIENEIKEFDERANELTRRRSEILGTLKGEFEPDHGTLEEWQQEMEGFAEDVEPVDRDYDPEELDELEERRGALDTRIDQLRDELTEHRDRLTGFESELRGIEPWAHVEGVEEVHLTSVEDLRTGIRELERFVTELDEAKETALAAIEILDEIGAEEESEIDRLFTEDDFVVETFRQVTDGNYTDVRYDEADHSISVECADGRTLTPYELSQGTYDLLYLTIRMKLATELLDGDAGFLVLDDAFVHSDAERTGVEIEVLEGLVEAGWQVLYFSFRSAVRDAIEGTGGATVIELDRLQYVD